MNIEESRHVEGRPRPGRKGWLVIVAGLAVSAFALSRGGGADPDKDARKDPDRVELLYAPIRS